MYVWEGWGGKLNCINIAVNYDMIDFMKQSHRQIDGDNQSWRSQGG